MKTKNKEKRTRNKKWSRAAAHSAFFVFCFLFFISLPGRVVAQDATATPDAGRSTDTRKPPPSWAPKLMATVKPAEVALGDPVQVTIRARYRRGVSVNLPLKLELGKFSELSRVEAPPPPPAKDAPPSATLERTFEIKVAAYELGQLTLPPIEVTALGPTGELTSVSTVAVPITVKSVMPNEPNPKPKGMEPPVSVFQRTWWLLYLIFGLAGVGLVVALTLIVSRRLRARREAAKPPPPPVPPQVRALARLGQLDVEDFITREAFKELYLLLSEIVREYVGGRWGFDALEMTTREIHHCLEARAVSPIWRQPLELFFNDCDLVKFAKYVPEADAARQARAEAERLVHLTTAAAPPAQGSAHAVQ